jgi:hypothetical protein
MFRMDPVTAVGSSRNDRLAVAFRLACADLVVESMKKPADAPYADGIPG